MNYRWYIRLHVAGRLRRMAVEPEYIDPDLLLDYADAISAQKDKLPGALQALRDLDKIKPVPPLSGKALAALIEPLRSSRNASAQRESCLSTMQPRSTNAPAHQP